MKTQQLLLVREDYTKNSTIGSLYIDGQFECFILENVYLGNMRSVSCIPTGTYEVVFRLTSESKYKYKHLHILNVPKRSWILLHIGNFPKDTLGCLLPGNTKSKDFVANSTVAFNRLMAKLDGAHKMSLTIKDWWQ